MRTLTPLSASHLRRRVTSISNLRTLGVPRWRLYASDVSHPLHGVVAADGIDPHAYETRVAAVRVILDEGHFLSRRTAARELGMPVRVPRAIEVGAVYPRRARRRAGVAAHQLRAEVLRAMPREPLWLPHPADAWGLLGAVCQQNELAAAGDFLVSGKSRRVPALCSIDDLEETVRRFRGGIGIERLRAALPLLRTGVESPAETALRLIIVRALLPEPMTCCPVETSDRTYYADLGYPELKIAIEYDGEYHFTGGAKLARWDNERIEAMVAAGWRVLRVTALDLRDPRRFLHRLAAAIATRR